MPSPAVLLIAVIAGLIVQGIFAYKQSQAFRRAAQGLRDVGSVSVGGGGRRYRGGKAFVALAFDETNRVRGAFELRGFTTFARPRPAPHFEGHSVSRLAGPDPIPGLRDNQREACRQAAMLYRDARNRARARAAGEAPSRHTTQEQ